METIFCEISSDVAWVTLWRPDRGNSYDREQCLKLTAVLESLKEQSLSAIILRSEGKNFCTGADLAWMKKASLLSEEENLLDMKAIRDMYSTILMLNVPLLIQAKGKIRGGGVGLVSCAERVICDEHADFALTEKSLGLIPGIITPFLVHKMGEHLFRDMAETGKTISAEKARLSGLVDIVVGQELDRKHLLQEVNNIDLVKFRKRVNDLRRYIHEGNLLDFYWKESARVRFIWAMSHGNA